MKKFYTLLIFIITLSGLQAQLETAHWRFGFFVGLDFTSGSASTASGSLHTNEGCASISDNCGNLLFYTDGKTVISKDNSMMQNGNALLGDASSTQSAIIIPNPDNPNIYYVFTTYSLNGVHYSVVDMSLNGGLGAVVTGQKNIQLPLNGAMKGSEKLTAVAKADNSGYWVITHYLDSYYAFSVTAQGVNTTPVISQVGVNVPDKINDKFFYTYAIGQLKVSPDGNKIVAAHFTAVKEEDFHLFPINYFTPSCTMAFTYGGILGLYDFDNETGIVSNETILNSLSNERRTYYGVEFSPDSKVLYSSYDVYNFADECGDDFIEHRTNAVVDKYDLTAASIPSSENKLFQNNDPTKSLAGSLQLALDGKIYHAMYSSLSYITDPNDYTASIFHMSGITLTQTTLGLPPFIASLFDPKILINGAFHINQFCLGTEMEFSYEGCPETIIGWDFGDGNTSSQMIPTHTYANSGTYTVTLTITAPGGHMETKTIEIEIVPLPDVQNAELKECPDLNGATVEFDLTESYFPINPNGESLIFSFHLSELEAENNQNPQSLNFTTSTVTTLWVRVENEWGCVNIVQLKLLFHELPTFTIEFTEVEICTGTSAELEVTTEITNTINWYAAQTGTTPIFTGNPFTTPNLTDTTSYWVEVESEEGCISERQEITVEIVDLIVPIFNLEEQYCVGNELIDLPTESENGIIGTWLPSQIDISQIGIQNFTFTPDEGQCADAFPLEIEVTDSIELLFDLEIEYCQSTELITLPDESENGITGIWNPAQIDTSIVGIQNFTFTPDENQCAETIPFSIEVFETLNPEFDLTDEYCLGSIPQTLETISDNGISGAWFPIEINTNTIGTQIYTFTPDGLCGEEFILEVTVSDEVIPTFELQNQYCLNSPEIILPTNSNNGLSGIWSPAIIDTNNLGTQIYSFTPDLACAETIDFSVTIVEIIVPEFENLTHTFCLNSPVNPLPNQSDNGISGTWFPNEINTNIQGNSMYTFTPNEGQCSTEYPMIVTVYPHPDMDLEEELVICEGDSFTYRAPDGFDSYEWKTENNQIISQNQEVTFTEEGIYTLTVNINGIPCDLSRNIEVKFSTPPTITEIKTTGNTITVYATGGNPLEYSMNEVFWQSSPTFANLQPGIFNVYVRDGKGCSTTAKQAGIMGVPNFISPNGDGYNDTWEIRALKAYPNTRLQIFDRYGKVFVDKILTSDFSWDGKYNSQPLPSGSYWYILILGTGEKLSGHITIRNQ